MSAALQRLLAPLHARVHMMVGRVTIAGVDSGKKMQQLQIELMADETRDEVEHFEPYGLTSNPKKDGAEGVHLSVGGLRSNGVVICVANRQYRLTGLAEGEVAIHDDQGQKVHLKRDGILVHGKKLTFESEGDIAFTAEGDMTFDTGKLTVTASDRVTLGTDDLLLGNGATLQAARKTDAVASGAITGGSAKVKIA
ncbi:MAG: phage baseplate assembly protein V [Sphingomonas sp.]